MARFLATFLLLALLVESAPFILPPAGGCSMPCCKRSGGKACCPRPAASLQQQRFAGDGCRMVACDAQASETSSIRLHPPAIVEGAVTLANSQRSGLNISAGLVRPDSPAEDPPTPPPRFLQV